MTAKRPTCPKCKGADVVRSRRRWFHYLLSSMGLYPYRCRACGRRIYRVGRQRV